MYKLFRRRINPSVIAQIMHFMGLSLRDTAGILKLTPAHTARLLRGNVFFDVHIARRVVRFFGFDAIR